MFKLEERNIAEELICSLIVTRLNYFRKNETRMPNERGRMEKTKEEIKVEFLTNIKYV